MTRALRLLALAASLAILPTPAAEIVRLQPLINNGANAAPGGTPPRPQFLVRNAQGVPRGGVVVRFDEHCTPRMRSEPPPYPCVSAAPSQALEVASDGAGVVTAPIYQANAVEGNAWVVATAVIDGEVVSVPFFYRIGTTALPLRIVSGDNQQVQVETPLAEPLVVRVADDLGRPVAGVPINFASDCTGGLPCLPNVEPANRFTDGSGIARSTMASANNVAGTYQVTAAIIGDGNLRFQVTNYFPRRLAVEPQQRLGLRITDAPATCSIDLFEVEPIVPVGKPRMLAIPHGIVRVKIGGCPAGATVNLQFLHPGGFPEGAKVWSAAPTWRAFETVNPVEGTSNFTMVEGGAGDIDAIANGRIEAYLGMAFGDPESPNFQSLWWTGFNGNGWGLSIVQHGSVLFPVFFVYDAAGDPTWLVMPGGRWNAARDEYSGALYSPRGKPLASHRSSDLAAGAPAGQATIRFRDALTAEIDLLMPGVSIRIPLVRQLFGTPVPGPTTSHADMWWPGPARDGWGLVLQQQYATVFALLFTYREDGKPTWVVMPSSYWSDSTTLVGNAFTTRSSSWPIDYDASKLTSQQVGVFQLKFGAGRLTFDFTTPARTDRLELTPLPF